MSAEYVEQSVFAGQGLVPVPGVVAKESVAADWFVFGSRGIVTLKPLETCCRKLSCTSTGTPVELPVDVTIPVSFAAAVGACRFTVPTVSPGLMPVMTTGA